MTEIEAYIYGHKIGTLIHHNGTIYFEYNENFKSLENENENDNQDIKKGMG